MTQSPQVDFTQARVVREWQYTSPFIACRFDPKGKFIFAAAQDQTIQRWNLSDDTHSTLEGHESWLRGIGFSPDGTQLYTAGYDGRLCFWETAADTPQALRTITAHDGWIRWLDVSRDGKWIATGGNDNLVKIWSTENGDLVHQCSGHESHVYSTYFHPDGTMLLSGDLRGIIRQWDLVTGKEVRQWKAEDLHSYNGGQQAHYGGVRSMSLSPDGKFLACSGLHKATNPFGAVQEPLVVIFNFETGEKVRSLEANGIDRGIAWRTVYHSQGFLIGGAGGGSGGFLLFWTDEDSKEKHKFKLPNTVLDIDLHSNQTEIVTAHHDRQIRISTIAKSSA